jgi:hypothetical protein
VLANACLYWRSITAQVLQTLQRQPMELSTVTRSVADSLDIELNNELLAYVEDTLFELRKLELVGEVAS